MRAAVLLCLFSLTACYEPASTWDSQQGRFRSTDEIKEEQRQEILNLEKRIRELEEQK